MKNIFLLIKKNIFFYPAFWHQKKTINYLLLPLSFIYFFIYNLRVFFAKIFYKKIIIPVPVICVGNATVGGTGKTEIVLKIAQELKKLNIETIIITNCYGGKLKNPTIINKNFSSKETGDEAQLFLENNLMVIVAKKINYSLQKILLETLPRKKLCAVIIDDRMQNPFIHKDFNILCIDGKRLLGNGFLIPAGPLREQTKSAFQKADSVIIKNSNHRAINLCKSLSNKPLYITKIKPLHQIDKRKNYFAFCSIGNPNSFFDLLKEEKINVIYKRIFPDHYNYTLDDIIELSQKAKEIKAALITTSKDRVKIACFLPAIKLYKINIICYDIQIDISKKLIEQIHEKIISFKKEN